MPKPNLKARQTPAKGSQFGYHLEPGLDTARSARSPHAIQNFWVESPPLAWSGEMKKDIPVTLRFGYTILYVPDVPATVAFYEVAFGVTLRFLHESGLYAEMETGDTTLAFAGEKMAEMNGVAIRLLRAVDLAQAVEIALICDDPQTSWDRAVAAGANPLTPPTIRPLGQVAGHVRDLNGALVELCSDMKGSPEEPICSPQ
ncbi:VOC family protein [Agrobacterium sp. DKPNP3]|uniref:VOC family protein n=1 Tax=Agrobacterium sp. DKPNP3 TaxID=3457323 RepID=UPI0040448B5C